MKEGNGIDIRWLTDDINRIYNKQALTGEDFIIQANSLGQKLIQAKEILEDDEYDFWIEEYTKIDLDRSNRFIKIYQSK